jgi:hypothetical protein
LALAPRAAVAAAAARALEIKTTRRRGIWGARKRVRVVVDIDTILLNRREVELA